MFLINLHKNQLRKKKERQSRRRLSTRRLLTESTLDSSYGGGGVGGGVRLTSHSTGSCSNDQKTYPMSGTVATANTSSGVYSDHLLDGVEAMDGDVVHVSVASVGPFGPELDLDMEKQVLEEEEEESDYSDEGIPGIDIPENILLEDLVFADNITSCNKVHHSQTWLLALFL